MEPKWLTVPLIKVIHAQAVTRFGGSHSVRDARLLESALDRPKNLYAYGDAPSLFELAAAYSVGIVKNHPFIDGNKRTGLLSARAFLFRNGYLFEPDEADEVRIMVAVADGSADESFLAGWLSDFSTRKKP